MTLMGPANRKGSTLNITNVTPPKGVSKKRLLRSLTFDFTQTDRSSRAAASKKKHHAPSMGFSGSMARGGNPALTATLTMKPGGANIKRVSVLLPHRAFLAQSHLNNICTRVQFNAGPGNGTGCPAGSVYGHATIYTPILDGPLTGNVYLRSSEHHLPDLVLALTGPPQTPIAIDLDGRVDSKNGGIRSTFENTPDAPVTKVVLSMGAGKHSLIENSENLCTSTNNVHIEFTAQNGKTSDFRTVVHPECPRRHKSKKH